MNKEIKVSDLQNNSPGSIRANFSAHPYHLVDPSPWPILVAFILLGLTTSAVMYFHGYKDGLLYIEISLLTLLIISAVWFRDIISESTYLGYHTSAVKNGLYIGFILFVVSEILFFFSIFWAFFHSSLSPTVELGSNWPPVGLEPLNPFEIPLYNTIILLSSGASITLAHHSLLYGNRKWCLYGIIITIVLAALFTSYQVKEYNDATFTIADSVFGSTFFFATGFHGFHVLIGTLFISVCLVRFLYYQLTKHHHLGFESSILYWHFVDVVWLFLYASIYWWGS